MTTEFLQLLLTQIILGFIGILSYVLPAISWGITKWSKGEKKNITAQINKHEEHRKTIKRQMLINSNRKNGVIRFIHSILMFTLINIGLYLLINYMINFNEQKSNIVSNLSENEILNGFLMGALIVLLVGSYFAFEILHFICFKLEKIIIQRKYKLEIIQTYKNSKPNLYNENYLLGFFVVMVLIVGGVIANDGNLTSINAKTSYSTDAYAYKTSNNKVSNDVKEIKGTVQDKYKQKLTENECRYYLAVKDKDKQKELFQVNSGQYDNYQINDKINMPVELDNYHSLHEEIKSPARNVPEENSCNN